MSEKGSSSQDPGTARERIAAAAIEEIGGAGFKAVSEEKIAARAGISLEQFHALYTDKTECYLRTYEAMVPEFMGRVGAAFAEGRDWRERLRRSAYASLDYFEEDPARSRFTTVELLEAGDHAAALVDASLTMLVELVDQGRFEADDPASIPRVTAETTVGSIWSLLSARIRSGQLADETVVPQLMYIAVGPYLGEEAAEAELVRPRGAAR